MKFFFIKVTIITLFCVSVFSFLGTPASLARMTSESYINWMDSLNFGGEETSSSASYRLKDTTGEIGTDKIMSALYFGLIGFRQVEADVIIPPTPPGGGSPGGDTTPPILSNLRVVNILQTSATVLWDTNEPATSRVNYGLTPGYGSTEIGDGSGFVLSHRVDLSGLTADTIYHFDVVTTDALGNTTTTVDDIFQTLSGADVTPPVISNIQVINITHNSATVTWDTDEPTDSKVEYGLAASYELGEVSSTDLKTSHSMPLSGLIPDTLYHFRVTSADASANQAVSSDDTFSTLALTDAVPPVISNIRVINITENSATVTWETDEPATSRVRYGLTAAYEIGDVSSLDLVTSHSVVLNSLTRSTFYHFEVSSADAFSNTATSTDTTFSTLPDFIPPANVSDFTAAPGDGQNTLTWINPSDIDFAGVKILRRTDRFPTAPDDGTIVYDGVGISTLDSGLTNGITYYYTAFAYDTSINFASGALSDGTPTAPPLPPEPPEPPITPPEPPEPPITPPEPPFVVPPITVTPAEKISLPQINFYTQGRSLKLTPNLLKGEIKTLIKTPLLVEIPEEVLAARPIEKVTFTFGTSTFLLSYNGETKNYEADFVSPDLSGRYASLAVVFYADGAADVIDLTLLVEPFGRVYEIFENQTLLVEGAKVTLFWLNQGGEWEIWPNRVSRQSNPQETPQGGEYGYLVPAGTYYLRVEKGGYASKETLRFQVEDNVINQNIEIFRLPIIELTLESLENVAIFTEKVIREEIAKIIDNPKVEEANEKVAAPAVAVVALVGYSTAISFATLFPYLQFLFTQPILLLFPKRRKGWGVVYHSLSKMPIDLAIVRLYEKVTNRLVQTRVTDREGRFAFFVQPGQYFIRIVKPNFSFPTVYLKDKKEDIKYFDIYHGEEILVTEKNTLVTPNIPLDPVEAARTTPDRRIVLAHFGRKVQNFVALSGIILATASVIISPQLWMVAVLLGHCILYALFRRLARPRKQKSWGIVYETATKAPVGLTVARIFETEYNKLLETQVTDGRGRYSFLVGNNAYYVTFSKPGYAPKQTDTIDLRGRKEGAAVGLDVGLEKSQ